MIEAFFGADEDEPADNTYGSFEVGLLQKEALYVRNEADNREKKCLLR